jgi:hypothetical protein
MKTLTNWIIAAVAAILLGLVPMIGHAAQVNVTTALAQFYDADEHCRGDQIPESYFSAPNFPENYPACARRRAAENRLNSVGVFRDDRDNWYARTK